MPLLSWLSAHRRLLVAVLVVVGVLSGTWHLIKARTIQVFGRLVARVETAQPLIALTFDDGPRGHDVVLDVLGAERVPATFFVCGAGMAQPAQMALARRMVAEGHELGNHSFSHQRMVLKSPAWIAEEVESTDRLIRQAGHTGPIHFRPPYGKKFLGLPYYLSQTGRTTIMWDVEPESYPHITHQPTRIVEHVLAETRPGSIILLHGAYPATQRAVAPLVAALKAKGFKFVRVSELLAAK